jgi:energy-coupling factor transporter ATP-binding protein EcfA2
MATAVEATMPDDFTPVRAIGRVDRYADNDALVATHAPRVPWDVFVNTFQWAQGEHVGLVGPTGQGKTTLLMNLLPLRDHVAIFATKPRDPSMDRLIQTGYMVLPKWENVPTSRAPRRIIWPNARRIDAESEQRRVFKHAFAQAYRETGWAIVLDEGYYISKVLGLGNEMRAVWTQGRSLGLSFVVATQRPRWVPLEMYDQSTHLFFWRENDDENLKRLSGLGAAPSGLVRTIIENLDQFQVLYVNTRNGRMVRTKAPAPYLRWVRPNG